jgi:hypothetical protein
MWAAEIDTAVAVAMRGNSRTARVHSSSLRGDAAPMVEPALPDDERDISCVSALGIHRDPRCRRRGDSQ